MEIRRPDLMTAGTERLNRRAEHGSVEALTLVSQNGKDLHCNRLSISASNRCPHRDHRSYPEMQQDGQIRRAGHAADEKLRHVP
jgi:hypothetical protein